MRVRHALKADVAGLAEVLTRSFADDPQMRFLFPDERSRTVDLARMFEIFLAAGLRRGNTFVFDDGGALAGGALWSPPEVPALSEAEAEPLYPLLTERYGDEGLERLAAMGAAMDEHHPAEPHLYLFIVGIDPARQGQGLGDRLLAPVLARADEGGHAAYLESSNPRNLGFYRRLGFETVNEFHPEGGPLFTGMWRDPR